MTEDRTTPPSDSDPTADAPASEESRVGSDRPAWTPPAHGSLYVPAGGSLPEGWYQQANRPTLRSRVRSVVTRRVPVLVAALALVLGLGVGGGVAVAATGGHGGDHTSVDGRGGHDAPHGQRGSGR